MITTSSSEAPAYDVVPFRADLDSAITLKLAGGETVPVLDFALQLIGRVREDGLVSGVYVRLTPPDGSVREAFVPVKAMTTYPLAESMLKYLGEPLTQQAARHAADWLTTASRSTDAPIIEAASRAQWQGDRLLVPGINVRPSPGASGYGPATDDDERDAYAEEHARVAWSEVLAAAADHPKLGLLIGAAAISPFLDRLKVQSFIAHAWAESGRGKTRGSRTALAVVGDPDSDLLAGTWNGTFNGLIARLKSTGGMPYLLDETGVLDARNGEDTLRQLVFSVASGQERQRADRTGAAREVERLNLALLSTGERRLTTACGLTGTRARVLEIEAPLVDVPAPGDAAGLADWLHDLAVTNAGWPLVWLLRESPPTEADLNVPSFNNPILNRLARPLAACRLGFEMVARTVGLDLTIDLEAATADLAVELEEAPVSKRVYDLLWEHFVSHRHEYNDGGYSRYGLDRNDGTWAIYPSKADEIARAAGIPDVAPAMRELDKQGVLIRDGKHLRKRVRVGGEQTRMYVLTKPIAETTNEWSQSPAVVGAVA